MKKIFSSLFVLVMLFSILPFGAAFAGEAVTYDLMAGQNIKVGTVTVSDDGTDLSVNYEITEDGWFIVQAHLYAGKKAPKNGAPGRFPFDSGPVHDTSVRRDSQKPGDRTGRQRFEGEDPTLFGVECVDAGARPGQRGRRVRLELEQPVRQELLRLGAPRFPKTPAPEAAEYHRHQKRRRQR